MQGLDLTQNRLKLEKKTKKEEEKSEKKIVFGAGFEPTTLRSQILHLTRYAKIAKCHNSAKILRIFLKS